MEDQEIVRCFSLSVHTTDSTLKNCDNMLRPQKNVQSHFL